MKIVVDPENRFKEEGNVTCLVMGNNRLLEKMGAYELQTERGAPLYELQTERETLAGTYV